MEAFLVEVIVEAFTYSFRAMPSNFQLLCDGAIWRGTEEPGSFGFSPGIGNGSSLALPCREFLSKADSSRIHRLIFYCRCLQNQG